MNNKYAKAYKEVLEIIKYFPKEEYEKIPKEKIEFYKLNIDKDYIFSINPTIDLSEQNISKETNTLIVALFLDYFASEEQKEKIKKILKVNEEKAEREKREKYNPDDLFKNKQNTEYKEIPVTENTQETALVEHKKDFFTNFKNFIIRLLHINK